MPFPCCRVAAGAALFFAADSICAAQNAAVRTLIETPSYSVRIAEGEPPRLTIERNDEPIFEVPVVSGLSSSSAEERLSDVRYAVRPAGTEPLELDATAKSTLWTNRRFVWRFLPDHIEFQQFASGHGALGRAYFLSNGVSKRWEIGTTGGHRWATRIDADRYLSPAPNHANQYEFTIAMPQTLGFGQDAAAGTESDFRPERMNGIFQPPPLFLAFHLDRSWMGLGIGTKPGEYQFPALEYTGSRYAGA